MADTVVQELVINTLTQAQFDAAKEAGTLSPYELYGTPDTSVRLPVLTPMWFDHIANDMSWLRADTFSWHSGDVYKAAHEHLLADYNSSTLQTETIGDITITYYLAQDGHKICPPDQESNLVALYEKTGVAWYYILDTENKQFKLPRKNPSLMLPLNKTAIVGTTSKETITSDTIGNTMTMRTVGGGIPSVNTVIGLANGYSDVRGFKNNNNDATGVNYAPTNLVARATNSISSDDSNKYLYFYVGNFEQEAVEQTAGITSETLSNKADIDLGNIPSNYDYVVAEQEPTSDNNSTWYREYKSGWVEQGGMWSTSEQTSATKSITLPVEMKDGLYWAGVSGMGKIGDKGGYVGYSVSSRTTTQLKITVYNSASGKASWMVKGYKKVG